MAIVFVSADAWALVPTLSAWAALAAALAAACRAVISSVPPPPAGSA